ncbi:MAG TPA: hypothetical protein VNU68_22445 [Verrucomicrobiae bacterium]|nr:hypothetical protein [Verrucomicrobiae bacterium]
MNALLHPSMIWNFNSGTAGGPDTAAALNNAPFSDAAAGIISQVPLGWSPADRQTAAEASSPLELSAAVIDSVSASAETCGGVVRTRSEGSSAIERWHEPEVTGCKSRVIVGETSPAGIKPGPQDLIPEPYSVHNTNCIPELLAALNRDGHYVDLDLLAENIDKIDQSDVYAKRAKPYPDLGETPDRHQLTFLDAEPIYWPVVQRTSLDCVMEWLLRLGGAVTTLANDRNTEQHDRSNSEGYHYKFGHRGLSPLTET